MVFFTNHTQLFSRPSKQGFDIVIGNPPYGELRDLDEQQQNDNKKSPYFKYAQGGRVNLFQFFYPLALDIARNDAVVSFIVQNSFLAEETTKANRELLLDQGTIRLIDSFPERYDVNKRVFKSVTMSVCICIVSKTISNDYSFTINIWDDKHKNSGKTLSIKKTEIKALYPDSYIFPSCDQKSLCILIKMKNKSDFNIRASAGEIDMTKYRPYFTQNNNDVRIITGSNISTYFIAEKAEFGKNFLFPTSMMSSILRKTTIINSDRIVMQRITGVNAKQRFIGGLLQAPLLCANSTNYISKSTNDIDLIYLLGILNANLLTFFDKLTNTNPNITAKVIGNLPIVKKVRQQPIIDLVSTILRKKKQNPQADTLVEENAMNELVYKLYDLSDEEIAIVKGE